MHLFAYLRRRKTVASMAHSRAKYFQFIGDIVLIAIYGISLEMKEFHELLEARLTFII